MQLQRTTIRLPKDLKKEIEKEAIEEDTTTQEIISKALRMYLHSKAQKKAKKIIFYSHDLGAPLDNLTRDDYYDDPKV